jgi:hypothetical protein
MYTLNIKGLTKEMLVQLAELRIGNTEKYNPTKIVVKEKREYSSDKTNEYVVTYVVSSKEFADTLIHISFSSPFFLDEIELLLKNDILLFN